jgi:hypothetical protein
MIGKYVPVLTSTAWFRLSAQRAGHVAIVAFLMVAHTSGDHALEGSAPEQAAPTCPCQLWDSGAAPAVASAADDNAVELGVAFRSDVDGFVRAIRFYKGAGNVGPHIGHLWTESGVLLATITYSGETDTGWQEAALATAVAVTAGSTYVASYYAPAGHYAYTSGFFTSPFSSPGPLHAVTTPNRNGVYRYGDSMFPDQSYNATNYWVDVVFDTIAGTDSRSQTGQWSGPFDWPVVAVHGAVMKTGEVLVWDGYPVDGGASAQLWQPASGTFVDVPNLTTNLFCAGHAALPDGRLLVVGGHAGMPGVLGVSAANIFDPVTRTWTSGAPMNFMRWYPTATALPDGRVLVTSGGQQCETCVAEIPEIYDPATDSWTQLTNAPFAQPLYPYMFVLPDGRILNAGSDEDPLATRILDLGAQTWTMLDPALVDGGSVVHYRPGKVMKSGSVYLERPDTPSTNTAFVLDATVATPAWRPTSPMAFPRAHHNLTALPDGTVLATGGGTSLDGNNPAQAVHEAEIWSPVTERWTTMAAMQVPRLYHSIALLLPDARVLTAGGGRDFGTAPNETNAEIFSPPYLFKGARPVITTAPTTVSYGAPFHVDTPDVASIASVSLIRLGSVTHAYNEDQRFLNLTFVRTTTGLTISAPATANLAPPGYYMLFLVNSTGVPSVAAILGITPSGSGITSPPPPPPPPPPPSSASSYTDTTVGDFLAGTVPPALAIVQTGDGEVVLAPADGSDFSASSLPAGWSATPWSPDGSATVSGGVLTLAGGRVNTGSFGGPHRSIEFAATFGTDAYEHVGFGVTLNEAPWAVFGTASGGTLYARSYDGIQAIDTPIAGQWLGSSHRYRIDWQATSIDFWVDGTLAASHAAAIAGPMQPIASSYLSNAPLVVDWMRVGPYAAQGTFTSRVFAASSSATWTIAWNVGTAAGGAVGLSARGGNTPVPDASWGPFVALNGSPATTGTQTQYLQYRADLTSTDAYHTPELRDVTLTPTLTAPPPPPPSGSPVRVTDTTDADFARGATDSGTHVATMEDGEVILAAPVEAEFNGSTLPADWTTTAWGPGGTATVSGGSIAVDGSRAFATALRTGPATLDVVATFSGAPYQHIGFGVTFNETPWAIFSTGPGGALYARSHDGVNALDTAISGTWLGQPHAYRIAWSDTGVTFAIDGAQVASHPVHIAAPMRPIISDYTTGGGMATAAWLRVGPYAASGTFLSRVIDGGATVGWTSATWTADVPAGTSAVVSVRAGNSATPDPTWTAFVRVPDGGGSPGVSGRYVQYRIDLATASGDHTPTIKDVTLAGSTSP